MESWFKMICNWCQKNEVEFELVIYFLKREREVVANRLDKQNQLIRNGVYLKIKLCERCLPCTATINPLRTKLRGHELQKAK